MERNWNHFIVKKKSLHKLVNDNGDTLATGLVKWPTSTSASANSIGGEIDYDRHHKYLETTKPSQSLIESQKPYCRHSNLPNYV